MSETELERGIAHLDFPVEEEKKEEEPRHWSHPCGGGRAWCGKEGVCGGYGWPSRGAKPVAPTEVTCVGCLQEGLRDGTARWWRIHNAWFSSTCKSGFHNCKEKS